MFIVLEGIDGCGKSTQARLLAGWLKSEGRDVLLTAEPTGGRIGRFIREILSGGERVDPKTLALLFTADRVEHLFREVEPALAAGKTVVSERYYHSTVAYQSAQGVDRKWLLELNKFARKPDLTILMDIDSKKSIGRKKAKEIFENKEFLEQVRDRYLKMPELVKVNADRDVADVQRDIQDIVGKRL